MPVYHWNNLEKRSFEVITGMVGYQHSIEEHRPPGYKRLRDA